MHHLQLEELLAELDRHVEDGEKDIRRQRAAVDLLTRGGRNTTDAEQLLRTFEELQSQHIEHRDRVRASYTSYRRN